MKTKINFGPVKSIVQYSETQNKFERQNPPKYVIVRLSLSLCGVKMSVHLHLQVQEVNRRNYKLHLRGEQQRPIPSSNSRGELEFTVKRQPSVFMNQ